MATHFYTISDAEKSAAISNMAAISEGVAFYGLATSNSSMLPMYQSRSTRGTHLFTTFIDERDVAVNEEGHDPEGIAFWCQPIGTADGGMLVNLYRGYNAATDDHLYTLDLLEAQTIGYEIEGVAAVVFSSLLESLVPLFRLRSPTNSHFYTVDPVQQQALIFLGYRDEGTCGFVSPGPAAGSSPFFRSYNPQTGGHFYTLDIEERDRASRDAGYRGDGISCYIFQAGQQPIDAVELFRCFNPSLDDHFFTTDSGEHDNAVNNLHYIDGKSAGWVVGQFRGSNTEPLVPCYRLLGEFQPNFFLLAPPPPKSLASNSNFFIASLVGASQNNIVGLSVDIYIQADIEVQAVNKNVFGFTFQLNASSPDGYASAWQQYVIDIALGEAGWSINNYTDSQNPHVPQSILSNQYLCKLDSYSGSKLVLRAGTAFNITLLYDELERVVGAEYSAYVGETLIGQKTGLIKDVHNGTEVGPAPIVAFQMMLVGYADSAQATLAAGGAGAFRFQATSPLMAQVAVPPAAEAPGATGETANSTYGQMSSTKSRVLVQRFTSDGTSY